MNDFDEYKQAYGDLYEKELLLESEAKQEADAKCQASCQ